MAEKIVAFVDREAGRDAPLTADDERMVRGLIESDPAVRALVDDLRATNAGLDTLLDDVAAIDVPDKLVALIRGHGANEVAIAATPDRNEPKAVDDGASNAGGSEDGGVVAFHQPSARGRNYGPLAAAASIALLISSGALFHVYNSSNSERLRLQADLADATDVADNRERELADAKAELQRFAGLADQASSQRRETADQLMANEEAVQQLEVERAALEGRHVALRDENQRLNTMLEQQQAEVLDNETARDRIAIDLADARQALALAEAKTGEVQETLSVKVDDLQAELDQNRQDMASLGEELELRAERAQTASADLANIQGAQVELERELAAAEGEKRQLQADLQQAETTASDAERRLASLQTGVQDAEGRLATVAAGLASAEAGRREAVQQIFGLEAELAASKSWLGQIAQYHRVYASTARRHLVEVGADELDHIQTWLTRMLGREIIAPDLTGYGVTFAGARLLAINDKPVAQLVYLDADNQPLALCIIPSTGAAKSPTQSANGALNLVDWRDGDYGYAVVGWSDPSLLNSLTQAIQPVYDL
ncbi:MAG: hypothetical protein ACR2QJ_05575 [Geminicoccaceae bacterium]